MKFLILTIQLFIFLPLNGQTKDSIYFYSILGQNDKIIEALSSENSLAESEIIILTKALNHTGELTRAIDLINAYIDSVGFSTNIGIASGELNYEAGFFSEALKNYRRVFLTDSLDNRAHLPLGNLLLMHNNMSEAIDVLKFAFNTDTSNLAVIMKLSDAYVATNQYLKADEILQQAFMIHGKNFHLLRNLTKVNFKLENCFKVHGFSKVGIQNYPKNYFFYYYDGMASYKEGDWENAYEQLVLSHSLNNHNDNILKYLGIVCFKLERYKEAVVHLKKCARSNERAADVNFYLGCSLSYLGDNTLALPYLQKALDLLSPDEKVIAEIYLQKGMSNRALKLYDFAERDFNSALSSDSTQAILALFYKASMYEFDLGKKNKAKIYFQQFIDYLEQNDLTPTEAGISYKDVAKRRVSAITEELFFLEGVKHE